MNLNGIDRLTIRVALTIRKDTCQDYADSSESEKTRQFWLKNAQEAQDVLDKLDGQE